MSSESVGKLSFCTQRLPPDLLKEDGALLSRGNQYFQKLALERKYIWPRGSVLRVRFHNGSPKLQEKVQKYSKVWSRYAEVSFSFSTVGTADIIVSFNPDGFHGTYIGTSGQYYTIRGLPSMNIGLTDNETEIEYSRVIVHEFGHALGCVHEHQSVTANIPWNKSKVYAYYAQHAGLSTQEVDSQILNVYPAADTIYTNFDKKSIMLYAIPGELTDYKLSVDWNNELSPNDKDLIAQCYPTDNYIGVYNTLNDDPVGPGEKNSKAIYWSSYQAAPPMIVLGFQMLDMSSGDPGKTLRNRTYADSVSTYRFIAHADTWSDTVLNNAQVNWLKLDANDLDFQSNVLDLTLMPPGTVKRRIDFTPAFSAPPKVFVSLSGFDISGNWCLSTTATSIDQRGFTLTVAPTANSQLRFGRAYYVAFAANTPSVLTGNFDGNASNGFSGSIDFGNTFAKTPEVFVAFTHFDVSSGSGLRIRVVTEYISQSGMEWKIETWGDTVLRSAGCSFLAM